ncbi:hypothetical protein D9V84_05610 [Bacteroidetes/Chlorobi group bacterium Naka2016]|nr:MAG: hypothetical protein D9V84_05610 [Bacteroidetes/Chlorobi group bacterium Naka2016]
MKKIYLECNQLISIQIQLTWKSCFKKEKYNPIRKVQFYNLNLPKDWILSNLFHKEIITSKHL